MTDRVSLIPSRQDHTFLIQRANNGEAIDELCTGLYNATAGRWGTNKDYVSKVMDSADSSILVQIMDRYSEVTGSEIYKDIENDYSGKEEKRILESLDNAYFEVNGVEYTGDDDGKLSNQQIVKGISNGIKDKALSLGLIACGTIAAPAIASGIGAVLTGVFGAATAAAISTVAAPVLAVAGIATAGYMIYKGVTQTADAVKQRQNATTDDEAMNAVESGTKGVIETAEGAYIGYQGVKGLVDSVKNIKTQKTHNQEIQTEAQARTAQEQRIEELQQYQDELIKQMQHPSGKSAEESAKVFEEIGKTDIELQLDEQKTLALQVQKPVTQDVSPSTIDELPEYLYHMTPTENYNQIVQTGKINFSEIEGQSVNGCNGVYMVSKDNLVNQWMGAKEPDIFGDIDLGETLLNCTGAGTESMSAIKIPVKSLDLSKLRFRPYIEACEATVTTFDANTGVVESEMATKGLPISELSKYIGKTPVEFVYQGELTTNLFTDVATSQGQIPFLDIIKNLFGK